MLLSDQFDCMVSRDTSVHIVAVVLGLVALFLIDHYTIGPENGTTPIAGFLLFYGSVFGGAHLYLALRGEDGMVPVSARWRFIALLAVLLGAGAVVFYAGERTIASVSLSTIGLGVILGSVVSYVLLESLAGYRSTHSE